MDPNKSKFPPDSDKKSSPNVICFHLQWDHRSVLVQVWWIQSLVRGQCGRCGILIKVWAILIHFFPSRKTNYKGIKIAWILASVSLWNGAWSHIRGRAMLRSGMITQHSGVDCLLNLSAPWQRSVVVPSQCAGAVKARETERREEGHECDSSVTDLVSESIWIRKCLLHDAEYQLRRYYGVERGERGHRVTHFWFA